VSPADVSVATMLLWVSGAALFLSFCISVWTIFSGPSRKNGDAISALSKRVDGHDLRLAAIPAKDDIHEMELGLTRIQGEMKTFAEAMRGQSEILKRVEALVGRHEDHLLKK
jgi:hypothetical protein